MFVNASEVHIFQFQSWQCIKRFLDVPQVKFVLMCGRMEANNNDLCLGCHHNYVCWEGQFFRLFLSLVMMVLGGIGRKTIPH